MCHGQGILGIIVNLQKPRTVGSFLLESNRPNKRVLHLHIQPDTRGPKRSKIINCVPQPVFTLNSNNLIFRAAARIDKNRHRHYIIESVTSFVYPVIALCLELDDGKIR